MPPSSLLRTFHNYSMTKHEASFGIIPLRKLNGQWQVLLIQHGKGHWGFPKGHSDKGETAQETAERELQEETGLKIEKWLKEGPLTETYFFFAKGERIHKVVTYYLAEVSGDLVLQAAEIGDGKWMSLEEALQQATFPATKALCKQLLNIFLF